MPVAFAPRLDLRVLLFSLAITVATGAAGRNLLPALRARRLGSQRRHEHRQQRRRRRADVSARSPLLIVAEVALTVLSCWRRPACCCAASPRTAAADPGFEPARVLAFDVSLPDASYQSPRQAAGVRDASS